MAQVELFFRGWDLDSVHWALLLQKQPLRMLHVLLISVALE
jgi:hypothetical protein